MEETITPDTKDWTWVLEQACPECGFDPAGLEFRSIGTTAQRLALLWDELLRGDAEVLARRPDARTWSSLEYGAHLRDVCRIMLARLNLMLVLDSPEFLNWDQDATALAHDYAAEDAVVVATELAQSAEAISTAFDLVRDSELSRAGRRSNGSQFTVETLAAYFLHDLMHHTVDVGLMSTE